MAKMNFTFQPFTPQPVSSPKPKPKQKRQPKLGLSAKPAKVTQPTATAKTGNPQYDALLRLQQQQASLTDLERLRQQLLSGDAANDATRQLQRGFLSNTPRSFNLLG